MFKKKNTKKSKLKIAIGVTACMAAMLMLAACGASSTVEDEAEVTDEVQAEVTEEVEDTTDYGVSLVAEDATTTGMTVTVSQSGGDFDGTYQTVTEYHIYADVDGEWVEPDSNDIGWDSMAFDLDKDASIQFYCDWSWVYGELPYGNYMVTKDVICTDTDGNEIVKTVSAEFKIAEASEDETETADAEAADVTADEAETDDAAAEDETPEVSDETLNDTEETTEADGEVTE